MMINHDDGEHDDDQDDNHEHFVGSDDLVRSGWNSVSPSSASSRLRLYIALYITIDIIYIQIADLRITLSPMAKRKAGDFSYSWIWNVPTLPWWIADWLK